MTAMTTTITAAGAAGAGVGGVAAAVVAGHAQPMRKAVRALMTMTATTMMILSAKSVSKSVAGPNASCGNTKYKR